MRRPRTYDYSAALIIAVILTILILLASCSIQQERQTARRELKQYYKSVK